MLKVVATDRESVAITTENKHMEVWAGQGDAACQWEGASVKEVNPVGIDEVWDTRRAPDTGDTNNFFMWDAKFLDDIEK